MAFTTAPRDLAVSAMLVVNKSGNDASANAAMAEVLTNYELLETQGERIVGQNIWVNDIEPLL